MTNPSAETRGSGEKKILIIEDEPEIVELLSHRFRAGGYEVVSARTGPEGLEKARTEQPNVILLDILIPEMDGFAVFRNLKRSAPGQPDTSQIPVVVLTAMGTELKPLFEVEGVSDYVEKPFDAGELVRKIDAVLKGRSSG